MRWQLGLKFGNISWNEPVEMKWDDNWWLMIWDLIDFLKASGIWVDIANNRASWLNHLECRHLPLVIPFLPLMPHSFRDYPHLCLPVRPQGRCHQVLHTACVEPSWTLSVFTCLRQVCPEVCEDLKQDLFLIVPAWQIGWGRRASHPSFSLEGQLHWQSKQEKLPKR